MNKTIILLGFWIVFPIFAIKAQSNTGTRGLVKAPTARMYEDGTLSIGAAFIPPGNFKGTVGYYAGKLSPNGGLNTFVTVNFFPMLEIMFRYTHELNIPVDPRHQYFPDRMVSMRLKILNENEKQPDVTIGMQDITAVFDLSCERCSYFSSFYLVGTKNLNPFGLNMDLSLGYGTGIGNLKAKEFKGLFGGIEISNPLLKDSEILIDYDSENLNLGVQKLFLQRFQTMLSYHPKYNKIGWVLAYRHRMY